MAFIQGAGPNKAPLHNSGYYNQIIILTKAIIQSDLEDPRDDYAFSVTVRASKN